MILPDADADTDSKKARAGPSSSSHPSGTPTHDAPTPPTPEPAPDSEPALDLEPESEPLPPYTPRERDPLLPTSARRRKPTRRARRIRMCTALLLVVSLTSAMTLRLSRPRTSGVSEVRRHDFSPWACMCSNHALGLPDGRQLGVGRPPRVRPALLHRGWHDPPIQFLGRAPRFRLARVLWHVRDHDAVGLLLRGHHYHCPRRPPQSRCTPADPHVPARVRQRDGPDICGGKCVYPAWSGADAGIAARAPAGGPCVAGDVHTTPGSTSVFQEWAPAGAQLDGRGGVNERELSRRHRALCLFQYAVACDDERQHHYGRAFPPSSDRGACN
jgi:hypothetical protein